MKKTLNLMINEMLINCVHLGHKKFLLNPHMKPYVLNIKNEINIINLEKTLKLFNKALIIIKNLIILNKIILIICTKKQSRKIIELSSKSVNMPYVNKRWLGGTLTNFISLKRSVNRMNYIHNMLKNKNILNLKKREVAIYYKKLYRSRKFLNGVKNLTKLPDLLFIIDSKHHKVAITEAKKMKIPVIAVVDTNSSPLNIDFLIPGNDDSYKSITFYMKKIIDVISQTQNKIFLNY